MALEDSSAHLHGAVQPRYGEVNIRNRGRLPHWEREEGLYFITFHLADSLPHSVLAKIVERHHILATAKQNNANLLPEQKALLAAYSHARIEEYFDRGAGSCPFLDMRIAGAMAAALRFPLWRDSSQARSLRGLSKPGGTFPPKPPTRRSDAKADSGSESTTTA
jgi:hypothetical protein